uniref:Ras-associating domain-containing protein n=1 Tax=Parastrongyloides trichosuri TaxID=131310 RepID=A0A0N4ZHJ3_PARTI
MRARSDSAIIRARYSSDVNGVNRFRHFHTPIVLSNTQKIKPDMTPFHENLPTLEKKTKKSSRILLDIAKPCQECGETSQKHINSHLPCLILHSKNRHISRDIITVASDIDKYSYSNKNKYITKKLNTRSNIILSEDSLGSSNRTHPNVSDYESGISKSSSFSNHSSIISNKSNIFIMENNKNKLYCNDSNYLPSKKVAKSDALLKASNVAALNSNFTSLSSSLNDNLSRKINFLNNNIPLYNNDEGLSIDKKHPKPLSLKQGRRMLKSLKYGMKSFSSDNLISDNNKNNRHYNKSDEKINFKIKKILLSEIGTQTDKVRFKKDKHGPKKSKKKKNNGTSLTLETSMQTEILESFLTTKAVQTTFVHSEGDPITIEGECGSEFYHLDLFNEFTKALGETIDRDSREYLSHHILSSIKEKGEAWRDAKKFVSTVLIPQSVGLANRTQHGLRI